ncbi:MAG: hypothetical protein JSV70_03280 [bacterium]|nr:MAG: hypothetical protein JSV70_03280 [bacterium]
MTSERMSPVDTAWLHMDQPGNPADIVGLMVFDEQVSHTGLAKLIEERMLSDRELGGVPLGTLRTKGSG